MRIDLTTLRVLVAVAEHKSIAKAADACCLVSSAVSKRISDLEEQQGVPLLYRYSRGVELTPVGKVAITHAKKILKLVGRFEAELSEYRDGSKGHVKIAACPSSVVQFLPHDISQFSVGNPLIKIDLIEDVSDSIMAMIKDGLADVGISSGLGEAEGIELRPYREDRLAILAPANHPVCSFDSINFSQTLEYNYVGLQEGSSIRSMLCNKASLLGKDINFSVSVLSFSGVLKMVEAGLGVTVIPEGIISDESAQISGLKKVKLKDAWAERTLQIAIKEYAALPLVAKNLVDFLEAAQPVTDL